MLIPNTYGIGLKAKNVRRMFNCYHDRWVFGSRDLAMKEKLPCIVFVYQTKSLNISIDDDLFYGGIEPKATKMLGMPVLQRSNSLSHITIARTCLGSDWISSHQRQQHSLEPTV